MQFVSSSHPVEIKKLLAHNSVMVKNLINLSKLKQQNFFVIVLFDRPILLLDWREVNCIVHSELVHSIELSVLSLHCLDLYVELTCLNERPVLDILLNPHQISTRIQGHLRFERATIGERPQIG